MITEKKTKTRWGWVEGKVNTSHEHFEITYGSVGRDDLHTFPPVALVESGRGRQYIVEFVVVGLSGPEVHEIRKQVVEEIEFYLIRYRSPGRSRWAYAVYHCGTAANLYSKVHWACFPKGSKGRPSLFLDRPAHKSLTVFKRWIKQMTGALGAGDDGSMTEKDWREAWKKFWSDESAS